jgi:hypothetical protein
MRKSPSIERLRALKAEERKKRLRWNFSLLAGTTVRKKYDKEKRRLERTTPAKKDVA